MAFKVGGKRLEDLREALEPPLPPPPPPVTEEDFADPLQLAEGRSPEYLLSVLGDRTLWLEGHVEEFAAHVRKLHRLKAKLEDPALEHSPQRPDAEKRFGKMIRQREEMAADIAILEAKCDRYWKALPPDYRGLYSGWWGVEPETPTIIGQAWRSLGKKFRWPEKVTVRRTWFHGLPPRLRQDIRKANIIGTRLGPPPLPDKDPFEDEA